MRSNLLASGYDFYVTDPTTFDHYTLSLHDALPILRSWAATSTRRRTRPSRRSTTACTSLPTSEGGSDSRSEEHTSELQSLAYLDCRLLLVIDTNLWASGYDVDGTDQTSLVQFSGRV